MSKLTAILQDIPVAELDSIIRSKRPKMRKALNRVIHLGWTYEKAAKDCGVTKQAIFDQLKTIKEKYENRG